MNKAATPTKCSPSHVRITSTLIDQHWLPAKARIIHKICTLTYQAIKTGKPQYLRSILQNYEVETNVVLTEMVQNILSRDSLIQRKGQIIFVLSSHTTQCTPT